MSALRRNKNDKTIQNIKKCTKYRHPMKKKLKQRYQGYLKDIENKLEKTEIFDIFGRSKSGCFLRKGKNNLLDNVAILLENKRKKIENTYQER